MCMLSGHAQKYLIQKSSLSLWLPFPYSGYRIYTVCYSCCRPIHKRQHKSFPPAWIHKSYSDLPRTICRHLSISLYKTNCYNCAKVDKMNFQISSL